MTRRDETGKDEIMKRIIDGKRYDTETAEVLGQWENMDNYSDFRHENWTLYRTAKGAYFLHYFGGPLSSYGRRVGNEHHGDTGLKPLDEHEARDYLEQAGHDGTAALEKYFPLEDA